MAPKNLETFLPDVSSPSVRQTSRIGYGKLPEDKCKQLKFISDTHVQSFDWFLDEGLPNIPNAVEPYEFEMEANNENMRFRLEVEHIEVEQPVLDSSIVCKDRRLFPAECRQKKTDYTAPVHVTFNLVNLKTGETQVVTKKDLLQMPLMVMSSKCHLRGLSPTELVERKEDHFEIGGYFIASGNEKVIRLLNMNRRNFPLGLRRNGWKRRRNGYSDAGIMIRCMDKWERTSNMNLHITKTNEMEVVFYIQKQLFHVPLMTIVRALTNWTDFEIYREFMQTMSDEPNYDSAVKRMLKRLVNTDNLLERNEAIKYLGQSFRIFDLCPPWKSDFEAGKAFLKRYCLIHLDDDHDKIRAFALMARKTFRIANNTCATDDIDSPESHDVLLPGHLFQSMTIEFFESYQKSISMIMAKEYAKQLEKGNDTVGSSMLSFAINKMGSMNQHYKYLIATGNLRTNDGLGMQQLAGIVVGAEKINFARFYSHFRCIHRGAFFMEMRATSPRKLSTAAWGFICPVHTPDGPPCGLLNHLAHTVRINVKRENTKKLEELLLEIGVKPLSIKAGELDIPVVIDGRQVGWIASGWRAQAVEKYLRRLKTSSSDRVPDTLEIVHCPAPESKGEAVMFPGINLLTEPARMYRPLLNLREDKIEMIGIMEQVWLHVTVNQEESHELTGTTKEYQELYPAALFSELACMSPFSNMNAGARVILQCQMAKQTFGWPSYTLNHRSDNKMYRILAPQEPAVRSHLHDSWGMDDYPLGTNVMIAVISYTGYDLEDATCVNKMSRERGIMYGTIYKTKMVDLQEIAQSHGYRGGLRLGCRDRFDPNELKKYRKFAGEKLDLDGLPFPGTIFTYQDAYYCYYDDHEQTYKVGKYDAHAEDAIVESVRVFTNKRPQEGGFQQAAIQFRIARPINIGDKMASRHGQKGICSRLWATTDMPWTENGMVPDLIFNPHGFPSRMTVGMMIEFIAGKAAMVNGRVYDSTPFVFNEEYPADVHFGEVLKEAGLNYHGYERMYSGISGEELEADIFYGPVYYQRLRHMVYDKFQARADKGPIDPYTQQPVKGRARGGGVRMGEMERDGLISHGCAFIARDRLFHCSDFYKTRICSQCGSVLSVSKVKPDKTKDKNWKLMSNGKWECRMCGPEAKTLLTDLPYVVKYLAAELAGMNVKLDFKFAKKDVTGRTEVLDIVEKMES